MRLGKRVTLYKSVRDMRSSSATVKKSIGTDRFVIREGKCNGNKEMRMIMGVDKMMMELKLGDSRNRSNAFAGGGLNEWFRFGETG